MLFKFHVLSSMPFKANSVQQGITCWQRNKLYTGLNFIQSTCLTIIICVQYTYSCTILHVFYMKMNICILFLQVFSTAQNRLHIQQCVCEVPLVSHHSRLLRPGEAYCLSSRATRLDFLCISLRRHCLILPGGIHFHMVVCLVYTPVSHVVYKLERQRLVTLLWHLPWD